MVARENEMRELERKYKICLTEVCDEEKYMPALYQYRLRDLFVLSQKWLEKEDFSLERYPTLEVFSISSVESLLHMLRQVLFYCPITFANLLVLAVYHIIIGVFIIPLKFVEQLKRLCFVPCRFVFLREYEKESIDILRLLRGRAIAIESEKLAHLNEKKNMKKTFLQYIATSFAFCSNNAWYS